MIFDCVCEKKNAEKVDRTPDLMIFSHTLSQLSYLGFIRTLDSTVFGEDREETQRCNLKESHCCRLSLPKIRNLVIHIRHQSKLIMVQVFLLFLYVLGGEPDPSQEVKPGSFGNPADQGVSLFHGINEYFILCR